MTLFLLNSQKHNSLRSRNLAVLATLSHLTLWSVNKTSPSVSSKSLSAIKINNSSVNSRYRNPEKKIHGAGDMATQIMWNNGIPDVW